MIAAETTCAAAIIFPLWRVVERDVAYRANLGAATAVYAHIGIDGELPVGYHEAVEVGTNDVAHRPGSHSHRQLTVARLAVDDDLQVVVKVLARLFFFITFTLGCVRVHERQADVALRHRQRLTACEHDAACSQFALHHLHGKPYAVAAGTQGVGVVCGDRRLVYGM